MGQVPISGIHPLDRASLKLDLPSVMGAMLEAPVGEAGLRGFHASSKVYALFIVWNPGWPQKSTTPGFGAGICGSCRLKTFSIPEVTIITKIYDRFF